MLTIRHETASDQEAVFHVERDAFGKEDEAQLVDALRVGGKVLLSLVAELDSEVVGHVLFSPLTVESERVRHTAVALGPIAVVSAHQGEGIGGRLIETGLDDLRGMGHGAVFLLGHATYYPRFGFWPAHEFDVHYGNDRDSFMALELVAGALEDVSGQAVFAEEFDRFS